MKEKKMPIVKIRYYCRCKSVEVSVKEIPEWPWILSGERFCVKCQFTIATKFIEEGEQQNANSKNTNKVKS